jgi:phospholipid N-methyltransferase
MFEQLAFLRSWFTDPWRVGAIAPSSRKLASLITVEITARHAPVIELGAGTGVFARRLVANGFPEDRLALIERDARFAGMLRERFPLATVLEIDAAHPSAMTPFGDVAAGAVISGLPLLWLPRRSVVRILRSAFGHLRADGAFYQFTYGVRCPVPAPMLDRFGLHAQRIGNCLANIPPASVYRITRRKSATRAQTAKGRGSTASTRATLDIA